MPDRAISGDNAALLLRGVHRDQVRRGQVVAARGSSVPHDRFTARMYLLRGEEGGRHTSITSGYRPQFSIRAADVVGDVDLAPLTLALPGDTVPVTVSLGRPVAVEAGLGFAMREAGRTVGAGTILEITQ